MSLAALARHGLNAAGDPTIECPPVPPEALPNSGSGGLADREPGSGVWLALLVAGAAALGVVTGGTVARRRLRVRSRDGD